MTAATSPHPLQTLGVGGASPVGVSLRPMAPSDRALIFSSWLRSYANSNLARAMAEPLYMAQQQALVEAILARGACLVAHPDGDPATVLGWVAHEGGVLHYAYVKGALRRAGIGRWLVAAAVGADGRVYSHRTHLWDRVAPKVLPKAVYNPMRAYGAAPREGTNG